MAVKRKLRKASCKICGKTFRRANSGLCIKAIHAHYVKLHPSALSRKIKKGMKKAKDTSKVLVDSAGQSFWNPKWIGFAERPLIEKITGRPYEEVKSQVLDFFVQMMLGGVKKPKG